VENGPTLTAVPDAARLRPDRRRGARPDDPLAHEGETTSVGVACWDGIETAVALVARTDRALYEAKRAGRDRTVLASAVVDIVRAA
jgi:PleD family two-component response regulator